MRHPSAAVRALAVTQLDPLTVFHARCDARALLVAAGELDLLDAVDVLRESAEDSGLVKAIGQDAVQAIMAEAFKQ
jgi:hypothetical protein